MICKIIMRGFESRPSLTMKFPPKPKTPYILDSAQDKRIFKKLATLAKGAKNPTEKRVVRFLYSQLERDWRTPLERFINKLLRYKGKGYTYSVYVVSSSTI